MKCLIVADIHYALKQFDWLLSVAGGYDLVVIAGDLLEVASIVERHAQIVVARAYLDELTRLTRVAVCSGNHDLDGTDSAGERVAHWLRDLDGSGIAGDGDRLDLGDVRISLCPWWDGPDTRDRIAAQLDRDARDRPARWFWVYHAPPTGSPTSWGGLRHYGDPALAEWIDRHQPDVVFCGHVHQSPFVAGGAWADRRGSSWIFNAGHQLGPVPCHIVIDTDRAAAVWISLDGVQELALDGAPDGVPQRRAGLPDWI